MSATSVSIQPAAPALASASTREIPGESLNRVIDKVRRQIAPLWPLKNFVAVNPFLGFSGQGFAATCASMERVAGARMLMPRAFYRQAWREGRITDADLAAGLAQSPTAAGQPASLVASKQALATGRERKPGRAVRIATVSDVLDALAGGDRHASRTAFMIDEISRWCAAYFDEGPAAWKLPVRQLRPYAAWRETMRFDRNAEAFGIRRFRASVASLPEDPRAAIAAVIDALHIPANALEDYLYRALFDIAGWAGHLRYLEWNSALYGQSDDRLVDLLAIRLVWGYALFRERDDTAFLEAWSQSIALAAAAPHETTGMDPELALDLALHQAYEAALQRQLIASLASRAATTATAPAARKAVQAVFCIDVRSEVFRRALETLSPDIDTLGFAGFFGIALDYLALGHPCAEALCPVLLKPAFTVHESVSGASAKEEASILRLRGLRQRSGKAWKSFKLSAVSSFTFVETTGWLYAAKILGDAARWSRTVAHPSGDGLSPAVRARIVPHLAEEAQGGPDLEQRAAQAEAMLRAMSMTDGFARLVLLAGHASSTVNNPYATGLDCGACGGHTGEANARVAVSLLNDARVRAGLHARGIAIPEDTWFLAGLHDTTTDALRLLDTDALPAQLQPDLRQLREWLAQAGARTRAERSQRLGIEAGPALDSEVIARSRDWSQPRPEWGLAGNAAFIAAPRERTRGLDLEGRAFLHSYDWHEDKHFGVLELIMTAPMVVASWINLQYYGSTVDNRAFGAGTKVLHNVVGGIGVLEGNAGDLRVGLPWQSVHDGKRFVHEPVRLNVFIAAPLAAMNAVIASHEGVRELLDNQWLHLFALDDAGHATYRYRGGLEWSELDLGMAAHGGSMCQLTKPATTKMASTASQSSSTRQTRLMASRSSSSAGACAGPSIA